MTQEQLDALHLRILNSMDQYKQGIIMVDQMLDHFEMLYCSYEDGDLDGLIDPATGLKYRNAAEVAEEEAEYQRMLLDIEQPD
jgi:hypothetical protein